MRLANTIGLIAGLAIIAAAQPALAQFATASDRFSLTVEGYANLTTELVDDSSRSDRLDIEDVRTDLAIRALGQFKLENGPDLGLRLVAESSPEDRFVLAEASILLSGSRGRLELGERQGLPDVLTGYAPNNFAFTGAEFGPASGPSLDPGGGLQHAFLTQTLAAELNELSALGAFASLAGDRSAKIVYVSPKRRGLLGGLSYSPDANDPRFGALAQGGLVHERFWESHILRLGGSITYAHPRGVDAVARRDLRSLNLGATLILDYDLMLGLSATWNGSSGTEKLAGSSSSDAYGLTASINYNRGPWTVGGYLQRVSAEGEVRRAGDDRLTAAEAGVSYRFSKKVRVYGAWYHYGFDDEGGLSTTGRLSGNSALIGVRATL
jgi:hypothetical protein